MLVKGKKKFFGPSSSVIAAIAPGIYATLDGVVTAGTLSNGNLTFAGNNGANGLGRSTSQKNSGKYYFEATAVINISGHANSCVAVITPAATANGVVGSGIGGGIVFETGGVIYSNDVNSGLNLGSNIVDGDIVGVAADLDNKKIWFRKSPSGNWNGQAIGSQNPAGNIGGLSLSNYNATTLAPAVGTDNGGTWTADFGQSAFSGSIPAGFTAGWTV
jgi:hypothetical protein